MMYSKRNNGVIVERDVYKRQIRNILVCERRYKYMAAAALSFSKVTIYLQSGLRVIIGRDYCVCLSGY